MSKGRTDGFTPFNSYLKVHDGNGAYSSFDPDKVRKDEMETAREEAEEILRRAREEASEVTRLAREEGLAQGRREGLEEFNRRNMAKVADLEAVCKEVQAQCRLVDQLFARENILSLIEVMVDRLVNHEVTVNSRVIQAVLLDALNFVVENSQVTISLHPDDFTLLKEASLENSDFMSGLNRVQLVEDPEVERGGCLLSTDFGEIDARIGSRRKRLFQVVEQTLQAELAARGGGGTKGAVNDAGDDGH